MNIGANMSIFLKTTKRNHTFFLIKHSKVELEQIKHADSTQILEFIDMEHTPKNLLIRAVKTGRSRSGEALKEMTDAIHGHLTLEKLLYPDGFDAKEGV